MSELTKYEKLKMYLSINGYSSVKELADEWEVTRQAIRYHCQDKFKSDRLDKLIRDFIAEGDKKFQEHRSDNNLANCQK